MEVLLSKLLPICNTLYPEFCHPYWSSDRNHSWACYVISMQPELQTTSSIGAAASIPLSQDVITGIDANANLPCSPPAKDDIPSTQTPVKKPTRQWAAWTRQEEESFFNALRQVGKNFEKITSRVQSKNKDQVRHYYYRLIKRINKLLGPAFTLDAKNSKDANAAMLRWWSLLEKHSCSASKLHLKPRRFKTFVTALEHQLLKDRKKTKRKASQAEQISAAPLVTVSLPSKTPGTGNETRGQKVVTLESHIAQKAGTGRGNSLKRQLMTSTGGCKDEIATVKATRQRRKAGGSVSLSEYKRWEKAAIAGVSLVADAAVHLERTSNGFPSDRLLDGMHSMTFSCSEGNRNIQVQNTDMHLLPSGSAKIRSPDGIIESGILQRQMGNPSEPAQSTRLLSKDPKLKLQLFPIDDYTRKAMEKDDHNPHLELTVGARKKISSIIEHLNRKWGNASVASGELALFPYAAYQEHIVGHHSWTLRDSFLSAADVYEAVGRPAVFRLRYGWFSSTGPGLRSSGQSFCHSGVCFHSNKENLSMERNCTSANNLPPSVNQDAEALKESGSTVANTNQTSSVHSSEASPDKSDVCHASKNHDVSSSCSIDKDKHPIDIISLKSNLQTTSENQSTPWLGEDSTDGFLRNLFQNADNMQTGGGASLATVEWADSLTNYSVGDFLNEASNVADGVMVESAVAGSACLEQTPFCSDSFDAAIAAHVSRHQNAISVSANVWHPSIWNADDTRDAFSFQKNNRSQENAIGLSRDASSEKPVQNIFPNSTGDAKLVEQEFGEAEDPSEDIEADSETMKQVQANERSCGISDIYWPDSLGCMIEFGFSSSRFQSQCLLNADSVSSLNGLIASSLDAFQNCSFFGTEKKATPCEGAQSQMPNSVALGKPVILDQSISKISENPGNKLVDAISLGT
ncbi:TSL-kinase interacting protein 1 isoform X2 [Nymphaea colorata]|uniref:TSL-kinase interacting protein 1 isoform X2 n=1 Tax=Nymphaea colorata TaxID=210225 RepID=UPI00129E58B1|nr:TSL-kinase interacting protein 1 isoform X2 [Nymphaea colorata]